MLKRIKAIIFLLLFCRLAYGQIQGTFYEKGMELKTPFTIRQFSTKDGLTQSQVIRILKRKDGSLILSTASEPVFFDGYSMRNILPNGSRNVNVYDRIWYCPQTDEIFGINVPDGKFMKLYPEFKVFQNSTNFFSAVQFNDSLILFGDSLYQTYYFKDSKFGNPHPIFDFINRPKEFGANNLSFYNGLYYNTRSDGLRVYDPSTKKSKCIDSRFIKLIGVDPYHQRIVGVTDDELIDLDKKTTIKTIRKYGNTPEPLSIAFRTEEEILLGTTKGLYVFYDGFDEVYWREDGLPSEHCFSLYYDTLRARLFVGSGERGLISLQFKSNYSFSQNQGVFSCNSLIRTSEGKILFINGNRKICRLRIDTIETYSNIEKIWASLAEIDGKIYAGTWGGGIYILENGVLIDSITPSQIGGNRVSACLKSSHGDIWIGTNAGLACGRDKKSIRPTKLKIEGDVITLYELKDGSICVGTSAGAFIIKDNQVKWSYTAANGYKAREVRCFYEDEEGRLWIGLYRGGLLVKDGQRLTNINELPNCMLNKDIFCLAPDAEGYFYITSNQGLWRIKQQDLFDFYKGKLSYLVPFYYGNEEGILNTEFNGGFQNKYIRTPGDHFYFPSIEGIILTVPETLVEIPLIPKINKVIVNDTLFRGSTSNFDPGTFSIEFQFSTTNLNEKENVYFQYKLINGKDANWSMPQKELEVNYKLLPPGDYTFVVRAINGFNNRMPNEVRYSFRIEPYIFQTTWFKFTLFMLLISAIFVALSFRNKQLRKKFQEKELYARMVAEIELKAIQAQLNPHFIFNCLNSIKSLILLKDLEKANQSLNTFARLTRQMLENSDKIFITFEEKIDFLKGYIELEKLRFGELFNYKMTWTEDVLPSYQIPHLLLQPYVENAIKHGLAHLEDREGFLDIHFYKKEGNIICRIKDNGIGREQSAKINELRHMHTPKGTGLTMEKRDFLKKHIDYHCTIDIFDLKENGKSIGTEIIITMPIYYESRNN